jgi:hypothetical protein
LLKKKNMATQKFEISYTGNFGKKRSVIANSAKERDVILKFIKDNDQKRDRYDNIKVSKVKKSKVKSK